MIAMVILQHYTVTSLLSLHGSRATSQAVYVVLDSGNAAHGLRSIRAESERTGLLEEGLTILSRWEFETSGQEYPSPQNSHLVAKVSHLHSPSSIPRTCEEYSIEGAHDGSQESIKGAAIPSPFNLSQMPSIPEAQSKNRHRNKAQEEPEETQSSKERAIQTQLSFFLSSLPFFIVVFFKTPLNA